MRASEFITEGSGPKRGTPHKNQVDAMPGAMIARDVGGYDRVYHMNRLWMAMACADGKSTKAVKMDAAGWSEKYNTIHPYTKEEENMVKSAMKTVPTDSHHTIKDRRSKEPDDTHRQSPIMGFAGYGKKSKKK